MDKQIKKHIDKQCYICGNNNYALLDVHRIQWGQEYSESNTVTLCANCHRKVHSGEIRIDKWHKSTKGRVLHYFENNQEFFK